MAVVMLETTASVDLFLPIIFTLFISYGTGTILINKSVYLSAIRSKNIPLLGKSAPSLNRSLTAFNIMHSPVVTFNFIIKVSQAYDILERTTHSGFPVLNSFGRPIGIIERDILITMIEYQAWYYREQMLGGNFGTESSRSSKKKNESIRSGQRQQQLQTTGSKLKDSIN